MDRLPLPRSICASLQDLCLMDFYINPFLLEWHHKRDNVFPATCNVDGSIVHLKFHEKGRISETRFFPFCKFAFKNDLSMEVIAFNTSNPCSMIEQQIYNMA